MPFSGEAAAQSQRHQRNIVIIARYLPASNNDGSATYMLDIVRNLSNHGFHIDYLYLGQLGISLLDPASIQYYTIKPITGFLYRRILINYSVKAWLIFGYLRLPNFIKNIYRSLKIWLKQKNIAGVSSNKIKNLISNAEQFFIKTHLDQLKPDIVIADYIWLADGLELLSSNSKTLKVLLAHDVVHQRLEAFRKKQIYEDLGVIWDQQTEARQLGKAQVIVAIQDEDANIIKQMAPSSEIFTVPLTMKCHSGWDQQIAGRCLFVGSWATQNVSGLQWVLENIWPLVHSTVPDATLHVCGRVCEHFANIYPHVTFMGVVDDLTPEYLAAEVCLIPLLAGSGLKIKIVEALAFGRATVSTSSGVQGIRDAASASIILADNSEDFAAGIILLLTNPKKRQAMEQAALKYAQEKFSPEKVYAPIIERFLQHKDLVASKLNETPPDFVA